MISLNRIITLALFVSLTTAHFTLDYPTTRGFDEDKENIAPCGSFNTTKEPFPPWYAANGPVQIDSHHDPATVQVFLSYNHNVSWGTNEIIPMTGAMHLKGEGEFCFKIDAKSSKPDNVSSAVIIVEHISEHGRLYQCSDVQLSDDASLGANISCNGSLAAASSLSPEESNGGLQVASLITSLLVTVSLAAAVSCLLS